MTLTKSEAALAEFLRQTTFVDAQRVALAGDASSRRYERLTRGDGNTAILMIAPPETLEPFLRVGQHLLDYGLSAPRILSVETGSGLLLLEDLGDALFAIKIKAEPKVEASLYRAAIDVLVHLHQQPAPDDLRPISVPDLAEMAALVCDWYADTLPADRTRLVGTLTNALSTLESLPPVMALRDYHAENLIWLPDRTGLAQVGLLDFQDAFLGYPAYDLVSLLRDARRDVTPDLINGLIEYYCAQTGTNAQSFGRAFATFGAQRNLRILGVFARLSLHNGKPRYVDLLPRVWRNLQADLAHPDLVDLKRAVDEVLPEPTPQIISELKK